MVTCSKVDVWGIVMRRTGVIVIMLWAGSDAWGSRAIAWESKVMQMIVKCLYERAFRAGVQEVSGLVDLPGAWEGYVRINEVYDYSWCYGTFESEKQGYKRQ